MNAYDIFVASFSWFTAFSVLMLNDVAATQTSDCSYRRVARKSAFVHDERMMTRHCHNCGWEYTLPGLPGRTESCHRCGADLKVCLNCVSYDPRMAHQCRYRRPDPVAEKHMANC